MATTLYIRYVSVCVFIQIIIYRTQFYFHLLVTSRSFSKIHKKYNRLKFTVNNCCVNDVLEAIVT